MYQFRQCSARSSRPVAITSGQTICVSLYDGIHLCNAKLQNHRHSAWNMVYTLSMPLYEITGI